MAVRSGVAVTVAPTDFCRLPLMPTLMPWRSKSAKAEFDVLADPGTYCYGGEPQWRSYFKSTIGHNTVEIAGQDQSTSGGPTLGTRAAQTRRVEIESDDDGRVTQWSAEHDGYRVLDPPALHRRSVRLLSAQRRIEVVDQIWTDGNHGLRLAFHLGPTIDAAIVGCSVHLSWADDDTEECSATLLLPAGLTWSLARGSTDPVLGWYSPGFGDKRPSTTVLGEGGCTGDSQFETALQFALDGPDDFLARVLN